MSKIILTVLTFLFTIYQTHSINAAPPSGNYLELNGGHIKAENTDVSSPSAVTLEAWTKPQSLGGLQHLLTIGDQNKNKINYQLSINGSSLQLTYYYSNNALRQIVTSSLAAGNWQHVAAVIST